MKNKNYLLIFLIMSLLMGCSTSFWKNDNIRDPASSNRPKILVLISSAKELPLVSKERGPIPAGFYLVELGKMLRKFEKTHDFVFATPDGEAPQIDLNGLDLDFHVQGPKAPWVNFRTNAGSLWREKFPWLSKDPSSQKALRKMRTRRVKELEHRRLDLNTALKHLGNLRFSAPIYNTNPEVLDIRLDVISRFRKEERKTFLSLNEIINRDNDSRDSFKLSNFDFLYIPGGHAPMVDLVDNPYLGEVLNRMHDDNQLIAAICHGPIALRSAIYRVDDSGNTVKMSNFPLKGATVTGVSSFEEALMLKIGYIRSGPNQEETKLEYYIDKELKKVGYNVVYGSRMVAGVQKAPGYPKVVHDKNYNILTANGPQAVDEMVEVLFKINQSKNRKEDNFSCVKEGG